ncbi:MAG TPA: type II toxin-antitoxin system VapC family toxin [Terriglobales bacterium]|nr:type II toxin-antitoxin system VapC family toxin [Terriglobales bacterium]
MLYADTSFLVSLYVWDTHSLAARELMKPSPRVWFTPFHFTECFHAIAQQVFLGKIHRDQAEAAYKDLNHDLAAGLWAEVAVPEQVFTVSADLARRHGPKLGVRTLDSLHVACALELKAERFWTFDERQAKLARAEGLKTS